MLLIFSLHILKKDGKEPWQNLEKRQTEILKKLKKMEKGQTEILKKLKRVENGQTKILKRQKRMENKVWHLGREYMAAANQNKEPHALAAANQNEEEPSPQTTANQNKESSLQASGNEDSKSHSAADENKVTNPRVIYLIRDNTLIEMFYMYFKDITQDNKHYKDNFLLDFK